MERESIFKNKIYAKFLLTPYLGTYNTLALSLNEVSI